MIADDARLRGIYAIVDHDAVADPLALTSDLLAAGIRLVQYRAKRGVDRGLLRAMHARTRAAGATLIVNDDLDALEDADGVHLGQEDLDAAGPGVRARVGRKILGVSAGTLAELDRARAATPDYLGTGPFRATSSKSDAGPAIGIEGLRAVVAAAGVPVAAIGGIRGDDLPAIVATGVRMAAVISALTASGDAGVTARALIAAWPDGPRGEADSFPDAKDADEHSRERSTLGWG